MRQAWLQSNEALRQRMVRPYQVASTEPEAAMPPYMESFLSHLRLLVGVPFEYLVPDSRLLPSESIRFFYLDRSWADRVVDGAVAVGKIGTREQAHHQAHAPAVHQQLDISERIVRGLQMREGSFLDLKAANDTNGKTNGPADVITGFLLRSSAVSGWPTMDVRAYDSDLPEPLDPASDVAKNHQLQTLRLERLSPSVLIALFQGIPKLVTLEEPHHGVQFGVRPSEPGFEIDLRHADGSQILTGVAPNQKPITKSFAVRAANTRVLSITSLRKMLYKAQQSDHTMPVQTGGASLAIEVLNPPWRQRFEGTKDNREGPHQPSYGFVASLQVAVRVSDERTKAALINVIEQAPKGKP